MQEIHRFHDFSPLFPWLEWKERTFEVQHHTKPWRRPAASLALRPLRDKSDMFTWFHITEFPHVLHNFQAWFLGLHFFVASFLSPRTKKPTHHKCVAFHWLLHLKIDERWQSLRMHGMRGKGVWLFEGTRELNCKFSHNVGWLNIRSKMFLVSTLLTDPKNLSDIARYVEVWRRKHHGHSK